MAAELEPLGVGPANPVAHLGFVLLLTLAIRLASVFYVQSVDPQRLYAPDSYGYARLARSLIETGRFDDPRGEADTRHTPGYPLLIAATWQVAGRGAVPVVLVQVVLSCMTILLGYWMGLRLWSPSAGLCAAYYLALDVPSFLSSQQLLTETFFTLAVTAAAAAGVAIVVRGRGLPEWVGLGAALTGAALIRPIAIYLIYPVLLWLALSGRPLGWSLRKTCGALALVSLPWALGVGGWTYRNGVRTGLFRFSAAPGRFLLLGRGADIVAQRDGVAPADARSRLLSVVQADREESGDKFFAEGWSLVRRHPVLFLSTEVRWLPELLFGTGAGGLSRYLGLSPSESAIAAPASFFETLRDRIERSPWSAALLLVAALHLSVVYLAGARALALVRSESRARWIAHAFLLSLALYFVLLSAGPQAYSRFRVPIMPLFALYAGRGLSLGLPQWARSAQGRRRRLDESFSGR